MWDMLRMRVIYAHTVLTGLMAVGYPIADMLGGITNIASLPPRGANEPFAVYLDLRILRIWGINQKMQNYKIKFRSRWMWRDCRLLHGHNESHLANDPVVYSADNPLLRSLWRMSKNQVAVAELEERAQDINLESFKAYADGWVENEEVHMITASCSFDFKEMPYDVQHCKLSLNNLLFSGRQVQLRWQPPFEGSHSKGRLALSNLQNSEWAFAPLEEWVLGEGVSTAGIPDSTDSRTPSKIWVEFTLKRKPASQIQSYVAPAIFFYIMSYAGLWMDPAAAPARVALGLLPVLMLINKGNALKGALPPISEATRLEDFMMFMLAGSTIMMSEFCMLNFFTRYAKVLAAQEASAKTAMEEGNVSVSHGGSLESCRCLCRFRWVLHRIVFFGRDWLDFHARWVFAVNLLIGIIWFFS